MLPFSDIDFFLFAIGLVFLLWTGKLCKNIICYSNMLLTVSIIYLLILYPDPLKILSFIIGTYTLYYLLLRWKNLKYKIIGCIILLIPLILMKANIRFHFYPFELNKIIVFSGLSYISFRIIHLYLDGTVSGKPIALKEYANFLLFTPTLLIGPIDRYSRFSGDLKEGYNRLNIENIEKGIQLIVYGIFHKFIVAEFISRYWLNDINTHSNELMDLGNTMYAYYFYLYFDFAGYSAMAMGLGNLMGINVPYNFKLPFLAQNIQDFWRRFHKTLGDFLNDYFFKPIYMFLSKKKSLKAYPLSRQNIAVFLTFALMGCWNGFTLNFILSGMLFGIYSITYNSYNFYCKKNGRDIIFKNINPIAVKIISIVITFHVTAFSLLIFSGKLNWF